jgi:hypothetical protein
MAWPVGLRYDPLFLRAVNYGGQAPIIFRPFLAPAPALWRLTFAAPISWMSLNVGGHFEGAVSRPLRSAWNPAGDCHR